MTKKHFIAIAAQIKFRKEQVENRHIVPDAEIVISVFMLNRVASDLADIFARENKSFDRARFLTACGLDA
jgi:hypothetical protein